MIDWVKFGKRQREAVEKWKEREKTRMKKFIKDREHDDETAAILAEEPDILERIERYKENPNQGIPLNEVLRKIEEQNAHTKFSKVIFTLIVEIKGKNSQKIIAPSVPFWEYVREKDTKEIELECLTFYREEGYKAFQLQIPSQSEYPTLCLEVDSEKETISFDEFGFLDYQIEKTTLTAKGTHLTFCEGAVAAKNAEKADKEQKEHWDSLLANAKQAGFFD